MKRAFRGVVTAAVAILVGCTTMITTRMIAQPAQLEAKALLDAASYVLVGNGFDIKLINESFGLLTTEWRPVNSGADTAASVLSVLGSGPATVYSRVLMIQVQRGADGGYTLTPKIRRQAQTAFQTQENVDYPTPQSAEGQLAEKIIQEINALLGLPNNYHWEEKTIEISPQR